MSSNPPDSETESSQQTDPAQVQEDVLDTSGLPSPVPVLRAARKLEHMPLGTTLRVVSTDEKSQADFQSLARVLSTCQLVSQNIENDLFIHILRRI